MYILMHLFYDGEDTPNQTRKKSKPSYELMLSLLPILYFTYFNPAHNDLGQCCQEAGSTHIHTWQLPHCNVFVLLLSE